jgi:two-component system LytT family sensor kinase
MAAFQLRHTWFIKYKLYHIPFWIVYNYVFWALAIDSPYLAAQEIFFSVYFVKSFFYTIFPAFAVYFNLYFLIPRYLQKGRYGWYILFLVIAVIASSFLIVTGYYVCAWMAGSNVKAFFGISTNWNSIYHLAKADPMKNTIGAITLGMSIKLAKNWIEGQRRQQALEKERLETELKFLKYQFNPHFLFNSINSIFFLIHKNPDMASSSLAKFSELLRHQLYECNDQQILLEKEIAYLENFIELEKLRQNQSLTVELELGHDHAPDTGIAPFILMTFVENAFKHVSKDKGYPNWIRIALSVNGANLHFAVSNSTSGKEAPQVVNYGGIGLKNVQRRLDLIYPGGYQLNIQEQPESFSVMLKLQTLQLETVSSAQLIAG